MKSRLICLIVVIAIVVGAPLANAQQAGTIPSSPIQPMTMSPIQPMTVSPIQPFGNQSWPPLLNTRPLPSVKVVPPIVADTRRVYPPISAPVIQSTPYYGPYATAPLATPFAQPYFQTPGQMLPFPTTDRKSTRLNSSHVSESRMPSSA